MKNIVLVLLAGIMMMGVTGCSDTKKPETTEVTGTLSEIMEKIYTDANLEMPEMMITEINPENEEYFLGLNDLAYDEAIASEPMMSSIAHSVVLLRASKDGNIEEIKEKIKNNVDGRKWICVGVEENNIIVDHIGNLIVLIMDEKSDILHAKFLELAK